jgi:phenylacetate-CoA ligase
MSADDLRDRASVSQSQAASLRALLAEIIPQNRFYSAKYQAAGVDVSAVQSLADLARLPYTTKVELLADQQVNPPYGTVLTYPRERYRRLHQTSGTSGKPLRWLDTAASWQAMLDIWKTIFQIVGIRSGDRLFFPFSFGPFLGFWTAFEAASRADCMCIPGGGLSSVARLRHLIDHEANVVFCTPTYALRLVEAAREEGIDLAGSSVRNLIVAGEPGGSIPATRQRIELAWGARVFDHHGLTETGPISIECPANPGGLHVIETGYIAEVIDPQTLEPLPPGQTGELVLTNLHRLGSPVIRYRTGDLVSVDLKPCPCGSPFLRLEGGIRGRTDDMILLRGNNVYPSALEAVIHRFPEVAEYRVEIEQSELRIQVEVDAQSASRVTESLSHAIRNELLFRAEVIPVSPGSLPRAEMKSKRISRK